MVCKYADDPGLGKEFVPAGDYMVRSQMQALKTLECLMCESEKGLRAAAQCLIQ